MRHRVLALVFSSLFFATAASALHRQGAKWPNGDVRVCWSPASFDSPFTALHGSLIRGTVDDAWGRNADLRFTGWDRCPASTKGWVVLKWIFRIEDPNPDEFGYSKSRATPVVLPPVTDAALIRRLALLEFGHALGFGPEEQSPEREDGAQTCDSGRATDTEVLTPYDTESVMWCGERSSLSAWDVVGLRKVYGFKTPGTLVGHNNRALEVPGASTATGIALRVANERGDASQRWSRRGQYAATLQAKFRGTYRCAAAGTGGSGVALQSRNCDSTPGQQFAFEDVMIRGIGGKCLDIPNEAFVTDQTVQLYSCHGRENQRWTIARNTVAVPGFYGHSYHIAAGDSGFCLEVPSIDPRNGDLPKLRPCDQSPKQRFLIRANGQFLFRTLCFDTQDDVPADHKPLQLYKCRDGAQNQHFSFTGPVKNGGFCLDIFGGAGVDGAVAQMYTCNGGVNQIWDYSFD